MHPRQSGRELNPELWPQIINHSFLNNAGYLNRKLNPQDLEKFDLLITQVGGEIRYNARKPAIESYAPNWSVQQRVGYSGGHFFEPSEEAEGGSTCVDGSGWVFGFFSKNRRIADSASLKTSSGRLIGALVPSFLHDWPSLRARKTPPPFSVPQEAVSSEISFNELSKESKSSEEISPPVREPPKSRVDIVIEPSLRLSFGSKWKSLMLEFTSLPPPSPRSVLKARSIDPTFSGSDPSDENTFKSDPSSSLFWSVGLASIRSNVAASKRG